MQNDRSIDKALTDSLNFLESQSVPYMLMGGCAVRIWGIPRPTYDIDFTISMNTGKIADLCAAAESAGYTVPEIHLKGFHDQLKEMNKITFQVYFMDNIIPIDIFLVTTEYQREAFARRVHREINSRKTWLISPEDLILHKLIAGRDRDLGDVSDILLVNTPLDVQYLKKWAKVLSVAKILERKIEETA